MAMIIVVLIRAKKKPVIKETILIEKSMTLGKSKSLHFQPGQRSRQLANISSTARSNGISWWDFGWVLLVDGVHLSLLDLSWPALSHFLINLAGWAGEAGILAKISIMPVSTERFRLAIYTRPIITTLSVQAHRLKKKEETLSSHGWGFGGFYLVGIFFSSITRWNSSNFLHCFSSPKIEVVPHPSQSSTEYFWN